MRYCGDIVRRAEADKPKISGRHLNWIGMHSCRACPQEVFNKCHSEWGEWCGTWSIALVLTAASPSSTFYLHSCLHLSAPKDLNASQPRTPLSDRLVSWTPSSLLPCTCRAEFACSFYTKDSVSVQKVFSAQKLAVGLHGEVSERNASCWESHFSLCTFEIFSICHKT